MAVTQKPTSNDHFVNLDPGSFGKGNDDDGDGDDPWDRRPAKITGAHELDEDAADEQDEEERAYAASLLSNYCEDPTSDEDLAKLGEKMSAAQIGRKGKDTGESKLGRVAKKQKEQKNAGRNYGWAKSEEGSKVLHDVKKKTGLRGATLNSGAIESVRHTGRLTNSPLATGKKTLGHTGRNNSTSSSSTPAPTQTTAAPTQPATTAKKGSARASELDDIADLFGTGTVEKDDKKKDHDLEDDFM